MVPRWNRWFPVLVAIALGASSGQAQSPTLAVVDGEPLTEADVRAVAASDFEAIDVERLQFEAGIRQREHETLERALAGIIADRLIQAEAERQGITTAELLEAEVQARVTEPTAAEIESIYQLNQQQLAGVSREIGMARVRQFLMESGYEAALEAYVADLRTTYGVESRLGPYRVEVATDGHPSLGPADAPVTLVEFSDFECPFCRRTQPVLDQLEQAYGDRIRLVYRQFPLIDIHPRAQKAAEASLCANDQGQFWPMHDAMFEEPIELEVASLRFKASNLGLDGEQFASCLESGKYADRVRDDLKAGMAAGVTGTPTIYINGRPVSGAQDYATYAVIIEDELARIGQ